MKLSTDVGSLFIVAMVAFTIACGEDSKTRAAGKSVEEHRQSRDGGMASDPDQDSLDRGEVASEPSKRAQDPFAPEEKSSTDHCASAGLGSLAASDCETFVSDDIPNRITMTCAVNTSGACSSEMLLEWRPLDADNVEVKIDGEEFAGASFDAESNRINLGGLETLDFHFEMKVSFNAERKFGDYQKADEEKPLTDEDDSEENTPLVLDWNRDGRIGSGSRRVLFDINADGRPEQIDWIGSEDAILALDRNRNGIIDDASELFGNHTPKPIAGAKAEHGFAALAAYDVNADGKITRADPVFGDLILWVDANENGFSEPSEIRTLHQTDVSALGLRFESADLVLSANATIPWVATYSAGQNEYLLGDVLFTSSRNTANLREH